ncbi:HET-domain-containing protein [Thozetella sp. PMI_491]|nr:HET-domain-containing protein [Thozetella sp. PMI_491]
MDKESRKTSNSEQGQSGSAATPLGHQSRGISASTGPRTSFGLALPIEELTELLATPFSRLNLEDAMRVGKAERPALCRICYNLDPYQAPQDNDFGEEQPSWVRSEYKVPPGTRAAEVEIPKAAELIESSQTGCLYCLIVRSALDAIHEDWKKEDGFIRLFLAPGLPVVVRIQSGAMSIGLPLGRESMRGFGLELQEGENMQFRVMVTSVSSSPIDIEIYRPRIEPQEITVGDHILSPLLESMGTAETIPLHSGDTKCFEFIKKNVEHCMLKHKCGQDSYFPPPLLPDRVIWVNADNNSRIRLLEPKGIRGRYIALSYCWGPVSSDTYLTNASTFDARKAGIEHDDLPPLLQDFVACARRVGIEYIWVDRICIIQGDDADFRLQAAKMGEIYGNAVFTVATGSASSESDRILVNRDSRWSAYNLNMNASRIGALKVQVRRRSHLVGTEETGGDYGKISTRAWIWQERLLSTRTVTFTPSALKFECRCHSVWEGFAPDVVGHSWSAQLDGISQNSWTKLVEEFMRRDITRTSDRLPAIESVMKRIERSHGWSPLWGLWTNSLVESLGWHVKREHQGHEDLRMNPGHYAPTWSWASVDGPISYIEVRPMAGIQNDPLVYDLEVRWVDAATGRIAVVGQIVTVELHCRIESYDGESPREKKYRYRYEISYQSDGTCYPIRPDVPLRPWSGKINGKEASAVIRIPYGETSPTSSWSARCLCILVGGMKRRSMVLFLGHSLREPGALERLGMTSGLNPALFENSPRKVAEIV